MHPVLLRDRLDRLFRITSELSASLDLDRVLNRALQLMGRAPGDAGALSPNDHVNLHQSTNDTFPTALRLAAIRQLRRVEAEVLALQEAFQANEKVNVACVGVGGQGGVNRNELANLGANIVALCDVDPTQIARLKREFAGKHGAAGAALEAPSPTTVRRWAHPIPMD